MLPSAPALIAYIDPATGSIVLQIVVAGMLSMGIFFRRALLSPFHFLFGRREQTDADEQRSPTSS